MGPCHKVHDDFIKRSYEERAHRNEKATFEDEFIRFCQQTLNDVERRIKRAKQRLAASQNDKADDPNSAGLILSEEIQEKMNDISEKIEQMLEQIEELGCEGKVEEAQAMMKLVEKLKEEKAAVKRDNMPMHWIQQRAEIGAAQEKQMEVCDVCGAFLIVNDVQQRVDDHLMGKQHVGFGKLKTSLEEILDKRRSQRGDGGGPDDDQLHNSRNSVRQRDKHRSRSKSKDGEVSVAHRDHRSSRRRGSREKSPNRHRHRDRRDRHKSRSRSRSKDRDGERRPRSGRRDSERDKDRERNQRKDKSPSNESKKEKNNRDKRE